MSGDLCRAAEQLDELEYEGSLLKVGGRVKEKNKPGHDLYSHKYADDTIRYEMLF